MRRVLTLAVVAGLVYAVVAIVGSLFGSDKTHTAASPTTASDPAAGGGTAVTNTATSTPVDTAAAGSATDVSASTATTVADAGGPPSAADPARVWLVGDSEAGGFSPYLQKMLKTTGVVDLQTDYKSSTGLARPDYFNWPARIESQLPVVNPDIVIALFGGNDAQNNFNLDGTYIKDAVGSDPWKAEYAKRVGAVMDTLSAGGRTLIWIGVPNAGDPKLANLKFVDEVVRGEIAEHPSVVFVDSWKTFSGLDGGYAEYVTDPIDGVSKPVRAADGFHLNAAGATILAENVNAAVDAELRKRGATI